MKYLYLCLSTAVILSCGSSNQTANSKTNNITYEEAVSTYAQTITAQELSDMLYVYASDEFEGRDTGEPGQKKAVEYLKQKYVDLDIASPLGGDNYFQTVPLEKRGGVNATLKIGDKIFENFENHVALSGANLNNYKIDELVYAAYGIDSDNYSDYTNIDVFNKIVLIKAGEPKDENGNYVTSGSSEPTKWVNGRQAMSSKLQVAREKGAKGLILLDNESFPRYATWLKGQQGRSGRLSLKSEQADMFALMVNEALATALYADVLTSDKAQILNITATIDISSDVTEVISENVVAYIKGSEKPDEVIVISAHLDHVGIEDGQVYNGADDDGSGTVAIVEIAQAFQEAAKNGYSPKRTILFLHVTGEEKGLLGSAYYADVDPIFPLDNTVANLNIDMIGRTDPKREGERNYVYLIGSDKLSTELHEISEAVNNKHTQIELDYTYNDENDPNRFYYRSDHYNFAKNNVPVIFYFNGTHADYHKPSDTPDKIEYDLLENRAKLVFYTAWELANRDERIVVDKAN
ncbi:M28 family peptidase [Paucihalobacter ruber]|uniref:M28 family peptidase n=1 Tax=Paucihalobacter ruber TaxID=2567861 RepID=A0A506PIW9_9FLAO|nr:M28 family peptidase [Paucihalobacter ruber]TPV32330.1 M28 family peptidase [Paucihalobacter ruber]